MQTIKVTKNKLAQIIDIEVFDDTGRKVGIVSIHNRKKGYLDNKVRMFVTGVPAHLSVITDFISKYARLHEKK